MVEVDDKPVYDEQNFLDAADLSKRIRTECAGWIRDYGDEKAVTIYRKTLLFDAQHDFDCYCRFIEFDREAKKRFYEPRRKQLKKFVDALQDLEDGRLELLTISCPPGVGKTTLALFFITWVSGRNPNLTTLLGSHSSGILRGMYGELLRLFQKDGEYNYNEVFPRSPLVDTNSKDLQIDLDRSKRFSTIQMTSPGASNAGKSRASNYLYCDDLVEGLETAMSADRLDKLWQQYTVDLRQRKVGTAKELHIATRWSVRDPIGRLETMYDGDKKALFLAFPALDEHDESNFDYPYHLGFSSEYYRQQREIMDEVSWKCIYMNEPIEREGLLYHPQELRRYFQLPQETPDSIIAVVDTKDAGPDYCVMPIAYRYGDDFYIENILCDNGKPENIEERIISECLARNIKNCRFESNRGAGRVAESVQNRIRERGGMTRITTKWSQTNKETRIISDSPFIKEHCLFKDESLYDKEYRTAMAMLCGWTMSGRNKHDDVPDAFSMLSDFIQNYESGRVTVMQRIF
jgi:predicted phage terminase large subunit-like protein